jgi:hypothetical protein
MNVIKKLSSICLAICVGTTVLAQEPKKIPDELFYLMPEFKDGTVYFRGQNPAKGKLNICAADNTLRFIDDDGKELAANPESAENIILVQIDTVQFMHDQDGFYRKYPVTSNMGVALKRELHILKGAKKGAYGMVDQTSSIRQYSTLYSEGMAYNLDTGDPYEISETLYLYINHAVLPLTKKNLKKAFPAKKDVVDANFKFLPHTPDEAAAFLRKWVD